MIAHSEGQIVPPPVGECINLRYFVEVTILVRGFFDSDDKARLWMDTPNPLLGGYTPIEMAAFGRGMKLLDFVRAQLAENECP